MKYLKIHDWDNWQSYRKDRGQPPWIKIHRCLMRNMKWVSLTDSERGQLVAIWLLAADHNGQIPSSPDVLQKLCFMEKKPNINKFIELGFVDNDGCHDDATMTPNGCHDDAPDKSRDRVEIETDKKREGRFAPPSLDEVRDYIQARGSPVNPDAFVDFYASNGWKVGKNVMKDWQACVRTWEKRDAENKRSGKISNAEHRQNIGNFIEAQARAAVTRLSEGSVSENGGDISSKVVSTVPK